MKIPHNILLTRIGGAMDAFGQFLEQKGYRVFSRVIRVSQSMRVAKEYERQDMLAFTWAGNWRKAHNDAPAPNKHIAFMELGFIPHYSSITIDAVGHTAKSSIPNKTLPDITSQEKIELENFLDRYYFAHIRPPMALPQLPPPPYVLFPLQHLQDSVIKFDAPSWSKKYTELVLKVSKMLPKDHTLIIKQHPKQSTGLTLYPDMKNVVYVKTPLDYNNDAVNAFLLQNSSCVLSINSSFILEALVRKIPVIALGRGIFTGHNIVKEVYSLDDTLFDNMFFDQTATDKFLYEVCMYRQYCHTQPLAALDRVWARFCEEYEKAWAPLKPSTIVSRKK